MPAIVCIVGASRPRSFTSLCVEISRAALEAAGAQVQTFDGAHTSLAFPHEPATEDAKRCKAAVEKADAVIIASPEYHGTFSAQTKLFIENLGFPSALKNKPVALLGVAGGRIGAIKAIEHLRGSCSHLGAVLIPGSISIAHVSRSFDEAGNCTDPETTACLLRLAKSVMDFVGYYHFKGSP